MTHSAPAAPKADGLSELRRLCTQELLLLLEQSPRLEDVLEQYGESIAGTSFTEQLNALMSERSLHHRPTG